MNKKEYGKCDYASDDQRDEFEKELISYSFKRADETANFFDQSPGKIVAEEVVRMLMEIFKTFILKVFHDRRFKMDVEEMENAPENPFCEFYSEDLKKDDY